MYETLAPAPKRRLRTAALVSVVPLVAAIVSGCAGSTSSASGSSGSAAGKTTTVAFVGALTPNVYYDAAACGFKQEAQKKGVTAVVNSPSTFSAQAQVSVLQSELAQNPKGLVVGPAVATSLTAPLSTASSRHIPVAVIANPPFDSPVAAFVNADVNEATGLGVDEMAKLLPDGGEVAIIALQPNSQIDAQRVNGYKAGLAKHPNLELVDTEYSGVNTAQASQLVSSILQAHPGVKGLLVTSGTPTTGAASQLLALNKSGTIKMIGYDASPTAVQAIARGTVQAVVSQLPRKAGAIALDSVLDAIAGKKITREQNYPPFLITADNMNTPEGKAAVYQSC